MKKEIMAKRYELIVFDWDGTLMDSAGAIVACIQDAAVDIGVAPPTEERARHVIGLGLHEALRYALPELPESRYGELAERYRDHYLSQDHELKLFAGIFELLTELTTTNHVLGVATGKSRKGLDRAMAASRLSAFFQATRCADECYSKPHPQMLYELMEEFGTAPDATLMIGDTSHDIEMARGAGVDALAVCYGAHSRRELEAASPLHCADTVSELALWLRAHA
jgi:phosphoglycolate phosphatase